MFLEEEPFLLLAWPVACTVKRDAVTCFCSSSCLSNRLNITLLDLLELWLLSSHIFIIYFPVHPWGRRWAGKSLFLGFVFPAIWGWWFTVNEWPPPPNRRMWEAAWIMAHSCFNVRHYTSIMRTAVLWWRLCWCSNWWVSLGTRRLQGRNPLSTSCFISNMLQKILYPIKCLVTFQNDGLIFTEFCVPSQWNHMPRWMVVTLSV